jgi:hypothetical protein
MNGRARRPSKSPGYGDVEAPALGRAHLVICVPVVFVTKIEFLILDVISMAHMQVANEGG